MRDYRKFNVSVNGRIDRTARLSETSAKVRYVESRLTSNAAAGNAASRGLAYQTVPSAGRSYEGGHEAARGYLQHIVGPVFSK